MSVFSIGHSGSLVAAQGKASAPLIRQVLVTDWIGRIGRADHHYCWCDLHV